MKKIICLGLIIPLIIISCTKSKPAETTVLGMWTDYYLIPTKMKGKVKEMKELNFWAIEKDGKITKGDFMTSKDLDSVGSTKNLIACFDINGTLTRYDLLDKDSITLNRIATIEDSKCVKWDYKLKDSVSYYVIPKYDNLGYLVGADGYRPLVDTLVNRLVIAHDGKGNYTKLEYYNYNNQKTGYHVCSLDEKGNYTESKLYNKADSLIYTFTNTYDDNGSLIKQLTYNEKLKTTEIWDYKDLKSDDRGNWIESYTSIDNGKFKIFAERTYIYYQD